jgi:hypothetical protein
VDSLEASIGEWLVLAGYCGSAYLPVVDYPISRPRLRARFTAAWWLSQQSIQNSGSSSTKIANGGDSPTSVCSRIPAAAPHSRYRRMSARHSGKTWATPDSCSVLMDSLCMRQRIAYPGKLESMLRSTQHADEARSLAEQLLQATVFPLACLAAGDRIGRLRADAENSIDSAAGFCDRREGKCKVRIEWAPVSNNWYEEVFGVERLACEEALQYRPNAGKLRPNLCVWLAECPWMPLAKNRQVRFVVEEPKVRPPGNKHRLARRSDQR